MSTTTTVHPSILTDYALHHSDSQANQPTEPESQSPSPSGTPSQEQPANWPSNHRRVPPYRPINRTLDFSERAAGANVPEYIFIQSMLHGVWLNASVSRLWRFTGGRITDRVFRYDVGGEY